ncbi:SIR2-like protein [Rahnella sp. BIGb0236]|uniref:SIR2 family protein n=1 Tax=Rahnella sp. BIGb0236 TaxID=2485117 RepID=UPI0010F19D49|nr:SIR2 family protein [Rahnella sp. BIGb0236]TDS88871.1 SIR2-like protein [Rahnella sp. BIGb0236]
MSNKEHLNIIRKAIDNNKLCIFVGAGASLDSNLPSWKSLIDSLKGNLSTSNIDSYLKVAEHYYIEYGRNAYFSKISDFFPSNSEPNILHQKILELKPQHIITTNWDDLLEKEISKQNEFFFPVATDYELASSPSAKLLIKMHGDIKHRNIVFRESDYLSFSDNFPLIENFVKSLFSTYVVLFVGYSISDYNLNLILSWIRNRTQDAPPAFSIITSNILSLAEQNYLTSKGVYPLFVNDNQQKSTEQKELVSPITSSIANLLSDISSPKNNKYDYESLVQEITLDISSWNIIYPPMLVKLIRDKLDSNIINQIYIDTSSECIIYDFESGSSIDTRSSYRRFRKYVKEILEKTPISGFKIIKRKYKLSRRQFYGTIIINKFKVPFEDEYSKFDYNLISNRINETQLATQNNLDEIFQAAFDSYFLKRPTIGREIFSTLTSTYFSRSQFIKSIVSSYNKTNCYSGTIPFEESMKIWETSMSDNLSKNDNISELINKFPTSALRKQKSLYQGLDFNDTFYLSAYKRISEKCNELNELLLFKRTNKYHYGLESLDNEINWIALFTVKNRIAVLYNNKFTDIAKQTFNTHVKYQHECHGEIRLNLLLCFLAVTGISNNTLRDYLELVIVDNTSILIDDKTFEYLLTILRNCANYVDNRGEHTLNQYIMEIASKILVILSLCNLGTDKTKLIMSELISIFEVTFAKWYIISEYINDYLINQHNRYNTIFDTNQLIYMIEELTDKLIPPSPQSNSRNGSLFNSLMFILNKYDGKNKKIIKDNKKIEKFILTISTLPLDERISLLHSSAFIIYMLSTGKLKSTLKRTMLASYKETEKDSENKLSHVIFGLNLMAYKIITKNDIFPTMVKLSLLAEEAIRTNMTSSQYYTIKAQLEQKDNDFKSEYKELINTVNKLAIKLG